MLGLAAGGDELSCKAVPLSKASPRIGDGKKKVNQIIKDEKSGERWIFRKLALQKIKSRQKGTEYRLYSPRETRPIRGKGYTGGIREELKFSPQKRMQLNFENEILGFYI